MIRDYLRFDEFAGEGKKTIFAMAIFFNLKASLIYAADEAGMYTMGALGDSLTTGFNAAQDKPMQNRFFNWAADNAPVRVYSHTRRLRDALGKTIHFINMAEAGARSTAIPLQTDRLIPSTPDYVTLMIGANDLCSWPSN